MNSRFVEVAVNVPQIDQLFTYEIPNKFIGKIQLGTLVTVPYGRRNVHGVVMRMLDYAPYPQIKPIQAILDDQIQLTPIQIELMHWIATDSICPISECISLMLPQGILQKTDQIYHLDKEKTSNLSLTKLQMRIIRLLHERGDLRGRQIDNAIPRTNWRTSMTTLVRRGLIISQTVLPKPTTKTKQIKYIKTTAPLDVAISIIDNTSRIKDQTKIRRKDVIKYLFDEEQIAEQSVLIKMIGTNSKELNSMENQGLITIFEKPIDRAPHFDLLYDPVAKPFLTPDQAKIWNQIVLAMRNEDSQLPFLLHGITGSGKTEIYLRAVEEAIRQKKQAIILVPEIALTPQTIERFQGRFPHQVGLLHSKLSIGEKYDSWQKAYNGEISVMVGPRSALFTPFKNLGLIVLDESHDPAYYQSGKPPFYHAKGVALHLSKKTGATVIFGSATPSIETYNQATIGRYKLLELPNRILAHKNIIDKYPTQATLSAIPDIELETDTISQPLPPVEIIDMREELKRGNKSIFSEVLVQGLQDVLLKKQQAILYLNRRGSSTYVFCRDCGYTLRCPNDDIPFTYHQNQEKLICHICGSQRNSPRICPECGSNRIRHYGLGTQQVEEETKRIFPNARVIRWDRDTAKTKGSHQNIVEKFSNYEADILIGTQMIAKGLDLPLVTLVGGVLADVGMNLPDFRANERLFQLLSQVSGRAGRSLLGGNVILQTFRPDSFVLQAAATHDYKGFYTHEIALRQKMGYPPYHHLMRLEYRSQDQAVGEALVRTTAQQLKNYVLFHQLQNVFISEPTSCYYYKINQEWRWQILIRGNQSREVIFNVPLSDWRVETNPQSLL
jgi:primosomal protein N' (replication factor Y)